MSTENNFWENLALAIVDLAPVEPCPRCGHPEHVTECVRTGSAMVRLAGAADFPGDAEFSDTRWIDSACGCQVVTAQERARLRALYSINHSGRGGTEAPN